MVLPLGVGYNRKQNPIKSDKLPNNTDAFRSGLPPMLVVFVGGWSLAWRHARKNVTGAKDDITLAFLLAWFRTGQGEVIKVEAVAKQVGMPRSTAYDIIREFKIDFARFRKGMKRRGLSRQAWSLGVNLPSPDPEPEDL